MPTELHTMTSRNLSLMAPSMPHYTRGYAGHDFHNDYNYQLHDYSSAEGDLIEAPNFLEICASIPSDACVTRALVLGPFYNTKLLHSRNSLQVHQ